MPKLMPPSIPRLPDPSGIDVTDPKELQEYLTLLTSSLSKHLQQRPPITQAEQGRLMQSASGKTFTLSIADDGTISAVPFGSAQDKLVPP